MKSSSLPMRTSTSGSERPVDLLARGLPADRLPQRGPVVQVVGDDRAVPVRACIASSTTAGVVADSPAKMPPVWNQRTPWTPKRSSQSTSPGRSWLAAVCPRSDVPTAPRTPKPRSVKFSPLRASRPMPSYGDPSDQRRVDAALQDEVFDQPADARCRPARSRRRSAARSSGAGHGRRCTRRRLPRRGTRASCESGPRRGRAAASPRRARRGRNRHSCGRPQRAASSPRAPDAATASAASRSISPNRRPRPAATATIQLPPIAATHGSAR